MSSREGGWCREELWQTVSDPQELDADWRAARGHPKARSSGTARGHALTLTLTLALTLANAGRLAGERRRWARGAHGPSGRGGG